MSFRKIAWAIEESIDRYSNSTSLYPVSLFVYLTYFYFLAYNADE